MREERSMSDKVHVITLARVKFSGYPLALLIDAKRTARP
jgi:hypothetical protein